MPLGAARFGLGGGVEDLGKLELIETQVASSDSSLNFTSLGSYNVHFLTCDSIDFAADATLGLRLSNDGGSSWISTGYQYASQLGSVTGSFAEEKSTNTGFLYSIKTANGGTGANETKAGYSYLYNLVDSSKYSFATGQTFSYNLSANARMYFSSAVLPTAETHNAIQVLGNTSTFSGTVSLYGIAES